MFKLLVVLFIVILYTIMNKIDDKTFRGGAHTQQSFIKLILNLTGSESHPQVTIPYSLIILKLKKQSYNTIKYPK